MGFEYIKTQHKRRKIMRVRFNLRQELVLLADLGVLLGLPCSDVASRISAKTEVKIKA